MNLKLFLLSLLSLCTLLLLLASFAISLYAWISYRPLDSLNQSPLFIIMLTHAGLLMFYLILSIIGVYGVHEKKQNYVRFYSILVFVSILVFLAGGIAAIKITPMVTREHCTDGEVFQGMQETANASMYTLCYSCPCYIPSETLTSTYSPLTLQSLSIYSPQISTANPTLPTKTQDCPSWNTTRYSPYASVLSSLETNLKCSGWCRNTNSLFYRFSSLHNGIPTTSCYESFEGFVVKAGLIIEIIFFTLTGISVFKLLVSCLVDVEDGDGDGEGEMVGGGYGTEAGGEEDKSNTNVVFAEKRQETFPHYQPKYGGNQGGYGGYNGYNGYNNGYNGYNGYNH